MNKDGYDLEHFLEREHQNNLNLLKLIEIYENRINKAIEYISECCLYDEETKIFNDDLDYYEIPKLLEILKGGD